MLSKRSFLASLLLPAISLMASVVAQIDVPEIKPQIPNADRNAPGRIFLEHADVLHKSQEEDYMVLTGDVVFTKGGMIMKCDSAHYYPDTESMNAYGNVSMEQGDTLFIYADEMIYDGTPEVQTATLYADPGKEVRLINRDVMLQTTEFVYNLAIDLGYYEVGGILTDPSNTLTSQKGEYNPTTKEANFYDDVHLNSRGNGTDTLDIFTDSLYYNTTTHLALLTSPSVVHNDQGTIKTRNGVYQTDSSIAFLFDRSVILANGGRVLVADTIFYNRPEGFGEAIGSLEATDTVRSITLTGDYGFFNELTDSVFVTGNAILKEYSGEDTLFLHSRYIESFRKFDYTDIPEDTIAGTEAYTRVDTSNVAVAYPRVRFFRKDLQGVCDSLRFTSVDSTLRMLVTPVIWSEDRQVFGNVIEVVHNDSTIERAVLPDLGFTAQHIEGEHYNQLSGKEMTAHFRDGEMHRLDINGNVEIIMYPEESDSTINKLVNAESSFLEAHFRGQTTERIKMWPETSGNAVPLFLARPAMYYLPKFKWYESWRPISKDDIFTTPPDREELMIQQGRNIPDIKFEKLIYRYRAFFDDSGT